MPDDHHSEQAQATNEALRVAAENAREERFRRLAEEIVEDMRNTRRDIRDLNKLDSN